MNYTDNIKGFRRRKVLVKLEYLLDNILLYIEDLEDLLLNGEYEDNDYELNEAWLEELEEHYSFVRGLYCQLSRGISIKRWDLNECNYISKELLQLVTI